MGFVELTRILPEHKKVKCSVKQSNIVYSQEPIGAGAGSVVPLTKQPEK